MEPPGARETLSDELDSIERRVRRTLADGREAFFEGSDSYDRAVVAIIRLAALLVTTTGNIPAFVAKLRSTLDHG